jgi:hypothetical protein
VAGKDDRGQYQLVIARRRAADMVALVSSFDGSAGPATLVLETLPEAPSEPDFIADAPLVAFDAFLADCRIFGWIRLAADRLTDVLNSQPQLTLVNVQLERFRDERREWLERLVLDRDRLLAVRAGGPRGDPSRRQQLRQHPLVVQSGPFLIGGFLHAPPGVEPHAELEARPPMVPLSMGWLEHWVAGQRRAQWAGTIIFNRAEVAELAVVREEDLAFDMTTYPIRVGAMPRRSPEPPGGSVAPEDFA